MDFPDIMAPDAAGRYLGSEDHPIPKETLRWWRGNGKGPKFLKIGGRVFYTRQFLDEYMASCVRDPQAA